MPLYGMTISLQVTFSFFSLAVFLLFTQVHDRWNVAAGSHERPPAGALWCHYPGRGPRAHTGYRHPHGGPEGSGPSETGPKGKNFIKKKKKVCLLDLLGDTF